MPSKSAIDAGRASVTVFTDNNPLMRGLRQGEGMLGSFARKTGAIGATVFGAGTAASVPFIAATKAFMSQGDRLGKMAARTGLSIESLSQLDFSTSQSGSSLETLETGIRRLQQTVGDDTALTEVFTQFGIDIENLRGLRPEDQLMAVADALAAMDDPAKRTAAAVRLFGRSGTQLLPMLSQGSAGIKALNDKADQLGLTMTAKDAKAAEELTDALDATDRAVKRAVVSVGASLAPTLITFAERLSETVAVGTKWIDQNRGFVVAAAAAAAGLATTGAGILAVAGAAKVGSMAFGVAAGSLKLVGAAATFAMSPIGLTIGAIGGLTAAAIYFSGQTDAVVASAGQAWETLKGDATTAIGGIKAALSSGDLGAAAEVAWSLIQLEWTRGTEFLANTWEDWKSGFVSVLDDVSAIWGDFVNGLADIWDTVSDAFLDGVQSWQNELAVGIAYAIGGEDAAREAEQMARQDDRSEKRRQATQERMRARRQQESERDADLMKRQAERDAAARQRTAESQERVEAARSRLEHISRKAESDAAAADKANEKKNSKPGPTPGGTGSGSGAGSQGFSGISSTRQSGVASSLLASSIVGRLTPHRTGATRNANGLEYDPKTDSFVPPNQKPQDPLPTLQEISGKLDGVQSAILNTAPKHG